MDRVTIDFSLANIITIGLIGAVVWIVCVGGWSLYKNSVKTVDAPAPTAPPRV